EVYWEHILVPGNKLIAVFDINQPNRPLHREIVPCAGSDLFFSIQILPGTPATKGQPAPPPQMKLVPTKPPEQPPKKQPQRCISVSVSTPVGAVAKRKRRCALAPGCVPFPALVQWCGQTPP